MRPGWEIESTLAWVCEVLSLERAELAGMTLGEALEATGEPLSPRHRRVGRRGPPLPWTAEELSRPLGKGPSPLVEDDLGGDLLPPDDLHRRRLECDLD